MLDDRDIEALRNVSSILDPLNPGVRRRVLRFLNDRYTDSEAPPEATELQPPNARDDGAAAPQAYVAHTLVDLEALYVRAKITAQWERALITGYWLQEVKRQDDFDALAINQAMRQCGYGISNITRELTKLTTWQLVVQQPAQGNGRRRFRVSSDGLRWSRGRLGQPET